MRFLYGILAGLGWLFISSAFIEVVDYNTIYLALAIIMAGAMAGGD